MKNRKLIVLCGLILSCALSAFAVDLTNNDHTKYVFKIHDKFGTKTDAIDGITTRAGVCTGNDECVVEVVGIGAVRAKGLQMVTIKDGKLYVSAR